MRSFILTPTLVLLSFILLSSVSSAGQDAYSRLAKAQAAGDQDAAREICLQMLKVNQKDTKLLRILAKIQLQSTEVKPCRKTLELLEAAIDHPDAELLEMQGDLEGLGDNPTAKMGAVQYWKKALKLQPGRISAIDKLAHYYQLLPDPAEEAVYLEQLVALRGHPDELLRLARHAVRLRDWNTVISCTARMQEKFANLKKVKSWQPVYDRLMRHSLALNRIDNRIKTAGKSAELLLQRAWLFDKTGLHDLAVNDAEQAYRLNSSSFAVKYQLAVLLAHAGLAAEASQRLAIKVSAYARRHLHPPADFFAKLMEIESRLQGKANAVAHAERAQLLLTVQQTELALDDAAAAVAIDPELIQAHLILARVFASRSITKAAKSAYRRILQLDANHLSALEELAKLHMQLGDYKDAIALFRRRLDLSPNKYLQQAYEQCFASLQLPKP